MDFHIRQLTVEDLPLMQYVGRATYEPYYQHIWKPGGLDWYMEKCFGTQVLESEFADSGKAYLLATDQDAQIVGFLKVIWQKQAPGTFVTNALYLEKIYLMPAFFRKGAGRQLIEWVLEKARQLDREAVWLEVMKTGPVQAYERAGFHNIGPTRFEHDLLLEQERDGWIMLRRL